MSDTPTERVDVSMTEEEARAVAVAIRRAADRHEDEGRDATARELRQYVDVIRTTADAFGRCNIEVPRSGLLCITNAVFSAYYDTEMSGETLDTALAFRERMAEKLEGDK